MRALTWGLRGVLFVFLLGFAVKNSDLVTLKFFFGSAWQMPFVLVILLFFVAGTVVGVTAALITVMKQRREIVRLRRELDGVAAAAR